ncbi:MAG: Gfo/Idh/MocA family oxidoreductase [Pirellulaceae bacterium]|nr:Gfo/Idh/MocA family oxidoreductase [Pirellulaceae bacterium]
MSDNSNPSQNSRRSFLKTTTAATAAVAAGSTLNVGRFAHGAGTRETVRIGLIGCGGRGSGAIQNALNASPQNEVVGLCDMFEDRLKFCRKTLETKRKDQTKVTDETCFLGFDGYKQLLETDIDVVLLCTPPYFRPMQLRAAIEAGKHVFCEKPVGVDAPGVRSVLETSEMARKKGLSIVSGLCWRYDNLVKDMVGKIRDGYIGDITTIQENYLTGLLWQRNRKDDWTEMHYQLRNWLYFHWLSGDHIVEQHIHSLDKALWLMGDTPPVAAYGCGGRQVRTDARFGNIYDHFAVCYEWANGVKTFAYCRQQGGPIFRETDDYVYGSNGRARILGNEITLNDKVVYKYEGPRPNMYDVEHVALFDGIRNNKPINNGTYMSYSTLLAILGREVCYTGKRITWEEMMNSQSKLGPEKLEFGDIPVPEVPMPGQTKFK